MAQKDEPQMTQVEQFISHSRGSFAFLRWAPVAAIAVLPFTFRHGAVPLTFLASALPIAALWLASMLLMWRTRREPWGALGFIALIFGARVVGLHDSTVSLSQFVQWLCIVVIIAGAPLLLLRSYFLRIARLA